MPDNRDPLRTQRLIGSIASWVYRVYSSTFRYRFHGEDPEAFKDTLDILFDPAPDPETGVLIAFWHQDELALIPCFRGSNIVIMVSDSKDGTILATALERFGYLTTRGSSSKGGVKAFVASLRMIRKGYTFAAAVDGPRGPAFKTKEGVVRLSEKSGKPIVPLRAWPRWYIPLWKTWSRSKLPLPFSRIDIIIGRAAMRDRNATDDAINALTAP